MGVGGFREEGPKNHIYKYELKTTKATNPRNSNRNHGIPKL